MTLTAPQIAKIQGMQQHFADLKADAQWLMASTKLAGDAPGFQAAFGVLATLTKAHFDCGQLLIGYDPAAGGGLIVQGPGR